MGNVWKEGDEAKVKSEWAKGITMKDPSVDFYKRGTILFRQNGSMELGIKILCELLYLIRDVVIIQNNWDEIIMHFPKAFFKSRRVITNGRCLLLALFITIMIVIIMNLAISVVISSS